MDENFLEDFSKELLISQLTMEQFNIFLENLKRAINDNSSLLIKANKEDVKINRKQIKTQKIFEIIDSYKNKSCCTNVSEKNMVIYRGDPYVTLHLCLQAIIKGEKIILFYHDFMYGVNNVLISIIKKELSKINYNNFIYSKDFYNITTVRDLKNLCDNVIVIGNTGIYQLLKNEIPNIKFFPYNNIAIYCESKELLKLQDAIYIYANENKYEIEIVYNSNIRDAIYKINSDNYKNTAVLLSQNDRDKQFFKKEIKGKDIFVNDNPFKKEVGRIYNYL